MYSFAGFSVPESIRHACIHPVIVGWEEPSVWCVGVGGVRVRVCVLLCVLLCVVCVVCVGVCVCWCGWCVVCVGVGVGGVYVCVCGVWVVWVCVYIVVCVCMCVCVCVSQYSSGNECGEIKHSSDVWIVCPVGIHRTTERERER